MTRWNNQYPNRWISKTLNFSSIFFRWYTVCSSVYVTWEYKFCLTHIHVRKIERVQHLHIFWDKGKIYIEQFHWNFSSCSRSAYHQISNFLVDGRIAPETRLKLPDIYHRIFCCDPRSAKGKKIFRWCPLSASYGARRKLIALWPHIKQATCTSTTH